MQQLRSPAIELAVAMAFQVLRATALGNFETPLRCSLNRKTIRTLDHLELGILPNAGGRTRRTNDHIQNGGQ